MEKHLTNPESFQAYPPSFRGYSDAKKIEAMGGTFDISGLSSEAVNQTVWAGLHMDFKIIQVANQLIRKLTPITRAEVDQLLAKQRAAFRNINEEVATQRIIENLTAEGRPFSPDFK